MNVIRTRTQRTGTKRARERGNVNRKEHQQERTAWQIAINSDRRQAEGRQPPRACRAAPAVPPARRRRFCAATGGPAREEESEFRRRSSPVRRKRVFTSCNSKHVGKQREEGMRGQAVLHR